MTCNETSFESISTHHTTSSPACLGRDLNCSQGITLSLSHPNVEVSNNLRLWWLHTSLKYLYVNFIFSQIKQNLYSMHLYSKQCGSHISVIWFSAASCPQLLHQLYNQLPFDSPTEHLCSTLFRFSLSKLFWYFYFAKILKSCVHVCISVWLCTHAYKCWRTLKQLSRYLISCSWCYWWLWCGCWDPEIGLLITETSLQSQFFHLHCYLLFRFCRFCFFVVVFVVVIP